MHSRLSLVFCPLLAGVVFAVDKTVNPGLDAELKAAATQLDRLALLPENSDWLFDFFAQPMYTYNPGSVINANAATFPAMTGQGMTLAMLNLGPCAMLPPHYHPRATNMVVAIEGTTNTYMIEENGARLVNQTLTPGKMTIFPAASLHTMQNTGCGNATLISALNSEDAGTHNIVNGLFGLPPDMIWAAFGGAMGSAAGNLTALKGKVPPVGTGAAVGSRECVEACRNGRSYVGP